MHGAKGSAQKESQGETCDSVWPRHASFTFFAVFIAWPSNTSRHLPPPQALFLLREKREIDRERNRVIRGKHEELGNERERGSLTTAVKRLRQFFRSFSFVRFIHDAVET